MKPQIAPPINPITTIALITNHLGLSGGTIGTSTTRLAKNAPR